MDKSRFLRIWEISALVSLCVCLCAAVWAQGRSSAISADLVRLHVLAVSDDAYEQALKLRVRDAVLEYITPRLDGSDSPADARAVLSRELDGIGRAAAAAAEGRKVTVSLGTELYPSREYEGFTLPAGRYESLRVVLGEGEGHQLVVHRVPAGVPVGGAVRAGGAGHERRGLCPHNPAGRI